MRKSGFTILKVVVTGANKTDSILEFCDGLNVVAGASNTGKTYAWQLIDYMLGASKPPKTVPFGIGYSLSSIEIKSHDGSVLTISRALAGGGAKLYSEPFDSISNEMEYTVLAEKHDAQDRNTISGFLLNMADLWGRQIRKNADGVKRSISFRDVAWLSLVDEERIITERSPILSGQYQSETEEKSAFGLCLTGTDDSAIITQEKAKDRKQRFQLQLTLLQSLLDDREARFKTLGVGMEQLPTQQSQVAKAVLEASELLATQQSELDKAAKKRDRTWSDLKAIDSHKLFLQEQIKRLELLHEHYASDAARLESALEAGDILERLPQGKCPVCGHIPLKQDRIGQRIDIEANKSILCETEYMIEATKDEAPIVEFQEACKKERLKIEVLERDLMMSIDQLKKEDSNLEVEQLRLRGSLNDLNSAMHELLNSKVKSADEQLSHLLTRQAHLSEAAFIVNEIRDLQSRYSELEMLSKKKYPKPTFAKKVDAAGTTEFCHFIENTLRAWKFPFDGIVSWSDDLSDLVIGGENRGSMGKGYRAVTHAAFTVSLMRYCRSKGLPHPGIVILDTPLNPYKGADRSVKEGMNMDVQEAFYADLAGDTSGDQVIIFENTEPPSSIRSKIRYTHFSGNPSNPPAGFFPISSKSTQ